MSRYWLLRPSPNDTNRMREFLEQNIIAIGWPKSDDLSYITKYEQVKEMLQSKYPPDNNTALGIHCATVDIFLNRMEKEDVVVVPDKEDVYFCSIDSEYKYDETKVDDGYCHQRKVKWLSHYDRYDLPEVIRSALRVQRTASELKKNLDVFDALAHKKALDNLVEPEIKMIDSDYPIRPNLKLKLQIPDNMTKQEAERFGNYVKTLYYLE